MAEKDFWVQMQGVVCAVAVGRRKADGALIVDPDEKEEEWLDAHGCFAFMFDGKEYAKERKSNARCVWTNWRAAAKGGKEFDEKVLIEARGLAEGAAETVYVAIFKSLAGNSKDDHAEGIDEDDDKMNAAV